MREAMRDARTEHADYLFLAQSTQRYLVIDDGR